MMTLLFIDEKTEMQLQCRKTVSCLKKSTNKQGEFY